MNPPDSYGAHRPLPASRQGVPLIVVALSVVLSFLLGLHFGKDSAVTPPPPPVAEDTPKLADPAVTFDPVAAARLEACQAEKHLLMASLARGSGGPGGRSDSSSRGSSGGASPTSGPGEFLAEIVTGKAKVQTLGDGSEVRVYGQVDNQGLDLVEGELQVVLINRRGGAVKQRRLPMALEPGLTSFDVIFSGLRRDTYSARAVWDSKPDSD